MTEEKLEELTKKSLLQNSLAKQQPNPELGMTQEYHRDNYEGYYGTKAKKEFKDSMYGWNNDGSEKQTYTVNGQTLHKSHEAAKRKYHAKNEEGQQISSAYAKYASEADHIVALKDAHNVAKKNPFISDEDFKKIMNSQENFDLKSKAENASKGADSEWKTILDKDSELSMPERVEQAKKAVHAETVLQGKFAAATIQNAGKEFLEGAQQTVENSLVPLTMAGVKRAMEVAKGESTWEEACQKMGKEAVETAVAGGKQRLLLDTVNYALTTSNNPMLNELANGGQVGRMIVLANIVQESAERYMSGEITGEEFIEEIGTNGATMVAGMIGGEIGGEIGTVIGSVLGTISLPGIGTAGGAVVGKFAGEVIGTIITSVACSAVISVAETLKHMGDYHLTESAIQKIHTDAIREMTVQREQLHKLVQREYEYWDAKIEEGFDCIVYFACEETFNIEGVTNGLNEILSVFGKKAAFQTIDEYENQLGTTLKLNF